MSSNPTESSLKAVKTFKVDRVGRNLLFVTARIQHHTDEGSETSGTSFFFEGLLGEAKDNLTLPVLITNKHVIQNAQNGTIRLLKSKDGEPLLGESIDISFEEDNWVGHPDPAIDLTATFVGQAIRDLEAKGITVFTRTVGRDLIPSESVLDDLDAFEPITFVGYPSGIFDQKNLTPIGRKGTTATPMQLDFDGKPMFLVDASIFPGSSGSPVFVIQENGFRQGNSMMIGGSRVIFVGVIASVSIQAGEARAVVVQGPRLVFDQMIDLGHVFNWKAVDETVDELCKQRATSRIRP
jgi:S1-C subfamily serine protease